MQVEIEQHISSVLCQHELHNDGLSFYFCYKYFISLYIKCGNREDVRC